MANEIDKRLEQMPSLESAVSKLNWCDGSNNSDCKPFADEWLHVDAFTVDQAAFLWCGKEPKPSLFLIDFRNELPSAVSAVRQMLLSAITTKALPAKLKFPALECGDGRDLITKDDLKTFAESKKLYPPFLFDTILPDAKAVAAEEEMAVRPKNKGGRPAQYDWDLMAAEVVRYAELNGLPATQSAMADYLERWFRCGCRDPEKISETEDAAEHPAPSRSLILAKLSTIYNGINKLGWKPVEFQKPPKSKAG